MTRTVPLSDTFGPRPEHARDWGEITESGRASDLVLMRQCASHDADALREIVRRYQPKLHRFLGPILGSREDTEEAVQDVFLRVWQQAHRFEGRAGLATWLYRVAANVARDLLRRRRTLCQTVSLDDAPGAGAGNAEEEALDGLERAERAGLLERGLQRLRAEDRLVLVLYYGEELGYDEMVQITGYAYPLLKVRLMRARQRLRAAMETLAATK